MLPVRVLQMTLILLTPTIAFAFDWSNLLDPVWWAPYAALLLALSELLGATDIVKSNGILQLIIQLIKKAFKKETVL